jgi:hypothetical protein
VRLEIVGHEEIRPPLQPPAAKEPEEPAKPPNADEFPVFGE